MLPVIRQFLEDHKITDIDQKFEAYSNIPVLERDYYTFVMSLVDDEYSYPFFKQQNTALSMYACGRIWERKGNFRKAIEYYKTYCETNDNNGFGYILVASCYHWLGNENETLKYMDLSAKFGNDMACFYLGDKYETSPDLHKSRYYFKLGGDSNGDRTNQTRVEQKLLDQFEIQLNKEDYLLAYELKVIHNRPGSKPLRILIENEYFEVLGKTLSPWGKTLSPWGLIKDLSNIVVSYIL